MCQRVSKSQFARWALMLAMALPAAILAGAQPAEAATSANTTVTLQMDNFAAITATSAVNITPNQADFNANQVTVPAAIALFLTTNDIKGATVLVSNSANPTIKAGDLQLRMTGKGDFKVPTTSPEPIISHSSAAPDGAPYSVDLKVINLRDYAGGANGGKALYSDTLTFTVVPN